MGKINNIPEDLNMLHSAFGLLVDDIQQAIAFYRDVLEYPIVRQSDTFAQMRTDNGVALFFWKWGHLVEHLGEEAMSEVKHRTQCALRFENPQQVDKAYEWFKSQGVKFLVKPGYWEWNAYAAYFVDDEGYMWEIFTWGV